MHQHTATSVNSGLLGLLPGDVFTLFSSVGILLGNIRLPTLFPSRSTKQTRTTGCLNWRAVLTYPKNAGLFSQWGLCGFDFQSFVMYLFEMRMHGLAFVSSVAFQSASHNLLSRLLLLHSLSHPCLPELHERLSVYTQMVVWHKLAHTDETLIVLCRFSQREKSEKYNFLYLPAQRTNVRSLNFCGSLPVSKLCVGCGGHRCASVLQLAANCRVGVHISQERWWGHPSASFSVLPLTLWKAKGSESVTSYSCHFWNIHKI